jgi:hypothetical protein
MKRHMMPSSLAVLFLALAAGPVGAKEMAPGAETFTTYEAFLSASQEPGEEPEAPKAPGQKYGPPPPVARDRNKSSGYAQLRFTRDLSKARVEVEVQGIAPSDIEIFRLHCGPPGVVGPIIVDFGSLGPLPRAVGVGAKLNVKLKQDLANKDVVFVTQLAAGLKPAEKEACPLDPGYGGTITTISAMELLARRGMLYVNLHTHQHRYYGELRGQLYPTHNADAETYER